MGYAERPTVPPWPVAGGEDMDQARIQRIHDAAARRGDSSYIDPASGLLVMTALHHERRGFCCGAGCRHCPYPPSVQADAGRPADAPSWEQMR